MPAPTGQAPFPRNDAEDAVSVTPVDYSYPAGDIRRYGAASSASASQNTAAIQKALSIAQHVYVPDGVYLVTTQAHPELADSFGADSVCLNLTQNGQNISGPGTLKVAPGTAGTSGAILANWSGAALSGVVIEGLSFDGNSSHTTGMISGLVIVNGTRCTLNAVTVQDITYCGIQFARSSTNCAALNCIVQGIGYIGIQLQKPSGALVRGNRISDTRDNAIDMSANDQITSQSVFAQNILNNVGIGIFLESGGNAVIAGNQINNCAAGKACIFLNQIHTPAAVVVIQGNQCTNSAAKTGVVGVYLQNNSGRCIIGLNYFQNLQYSIYFKIGAQVDVEANYHDGITQALVGIARGANQMVYSKVVQQTIYNRRSPISGMPFTSSPLDNTNNFNARGYGSSVLPAYQLNGGAAGSLEAEYVRESSTTTPNAAWSNAYALYRGGATLVNIRSVAAPGDYVLINKTLFYLKAATGGGWRIQNLAFADGNYTATVNGSYPTTEYWPSWQLN